MNEKIKQLCEQAKAYATESTKDFTGDESVVWMDCYTEKFAELIVQECVRLNKHQSYELMGVITDVEEGDGFDDICLRTVKRVAENLATNLKEHFGVDIK